MAQPLPAPTDAPVAAPRPLVFPSEATMPESKEHLNLRTALYLVLLEELATRAWIGSDQFVYFDAADPARVLAPDVFVRRGGPDEPFDSWKTWERGAPEFAIEIISGSDARLTTWERKLERYHSLGIHELARFERASRHPLRLWDRRSGDLVERIVQGDSTHSRVLDLDLVVKDDSLRLAREGRILLTPQERARAEAKRAEAEAERAEAEAKRAEAEAERAERLRRKLLAAGIDPEE